MFSKIVAIRIYSIEKDTFFNKIFKYYDLFILKCDASAHRINTKCHKQAYEPRDVVLRPI